MKSGLSKTIRFIVFLGFGILLLLIAFKGISFKNLISILAEANYLWLFIAVAASVIAFFIRARRWIILIEPLGKKPSLRNTYHSVMIGYLANLAFPRLGEVMRCAALGKKENMPFDKLVGTVIIERTIDLLTVLVLLAFLIVYGGSSTGSFLSNNILKPIGTKLSVLFGFSSPAYVIVTALIVLSGWLIYKFRHNLSKKPLIKKIIDFITGIFDGLKTIASLKRKWEFLILTVLLWSLYLLMSWLPLYCLTSTEGLGAGAGLFILIVGSLGMTLPVPSGVGAYHWIVSRGMDVVYGVPVEQGLAYATISHESQIIVVAILGAISMLVLFGRKGTKGLRPVEKKTE